jgi:hypothetical protein
MKRLIVPAAICGLLLVACTPKEPATAPEPATPVTPAPAAAPAASPAPDARIGTLQLSCGGESFRVAFEEARAVVVNADGSNTDLPLLPPSPSSEPGVATYTNGAMTFAKSGGGDTPTVIRFARGRMAFQDCAIAQN